MQIAQRMAGYSLGAADLLRRAMGKKIRAEMDAQRETFLAGATARGIAAGEGRRGVRPDGQVRRLRLQQVARRGLRAGRLSDRLDEGEPSGRVPRRLHEPRRSATPTVWRRCGRTRSAPASRCCRPTSTAASADFARGARRRRRQCIRYALAAIKRVGRAAMEGLVAARGDAPFADLADLAARVDPRHLKDGARESRARRRLGRRGGNRARAFAAAETVLRRAQASAEQRTAARTACSAPAESPNRCACPRAGLAGDGAPGRRGGGDRLSPHRPPARRLCDGAAPAGCGAQQPAAPRAQAGLGRVKLAGLVAPKERATRTGSRMAWVRLSDALAASR